ncbi:MAG: prepilin-type N-terminal cleavage/methylation domain-containing protein [Planctomycetota bacterium]|nr:prepilin-type N-terminal cleavage/methylation domain-containing protein [Planctomycetota bacterium]
MRNGFTILELMIVIAIIAIISAVAVPNLLQSRIATNESLTRTVIMEIGLTQEVFRNNFDNIHHVSEGGYSPNYRNLYYANHPDLNAPIALIPKTYADAAVNDNGGSDFLPRTTPDLPIKHIQKPFKPPFEHAPHNGYLFGKPNDVSDAWFQTDYALLAVPASLGNTGSTVFCLTSGGSVFGRPAIDFGGLKANDDGYTVYGAITGSPAGGNKSGWK